MTLQHRHLHWDVHIKCSIYASQTDSGQQRQAVGYTFQGRDCDRCRSSSEENEVQSHPFTFRGVFEGCGFCFPHAIAWLEHISWHYLIPGLWHDDVSNIFHRIMSWGFLVEQLGEFSLQLLDTSSPTCMADLLIFCNSPANAPIW